MPRKKKKRIKPEKLIAALYCRVSTYDQTVLDFSSLDAQEQALKDWCKDEGWQVYQVYIDKGISAKDLKRPALKMLRNDAKSGKFNQIIYTKMDRLSRSLRDHLLLTDEFDDLGIITKSKSEPFIGDGIMGRMFHQMLMVFSEMERQMIAERNHEKRYQTVKSGRPPGGRAPIGYDYINSKLVVNKKYEKIIKRIYQEYINGITPIEIAKQLNKEGFDTPVRLTQKGQNKGKKRGGKSFNKKMILDILNNKTYTGINKFYEEEFKGEHKEIISKAIFKKVKKIRKKKSLKKLPGKPKTSDLLLLGLLKCGYCGKWMTSVPSHKKTKAGLNIHYYYRCTSAIHRGAKGCKGGQVSAKAIEQFIKDWIQRFIQDNKEFKKEAESDAIKLDAIRIDKLKKKKKSIQGNLKKKKIELNNLLNIAKVASRTIKELASAIELLSKDVIDIESELSNLDLEMDIIRGRTITPKELIKSLEKIVPYLEQSSKNELRSIYNLIMKDIQIKKPTPPDEKWAITVNAWSHDSSTYILEMLSGSCYRPQLYPEQDSNL